jgi:hypothetical protein
LIPRAVRLAYAAFLAVWIPVYWIHHGPTNFLWLCDVGNLLVGAALLTGNRLLLSSQACGLLVPCAGFVVDLVGRLVLGFHPLGGTEFMLDASLPLWLRLLSLFHVAVPALVLWAIARTGYDGRALRLQTAIAWAVLALSFALAAHKNVNFVVRPFGRTPPFPAGVWFASTFVLYPLVLFLPAHWLLARWKGRAGSPSEAEVADRP